MLACLSPSCSSQSPSSWPAWSQNLFPRGCSPELRALQGRLQVLQRTHTHAKASSHSQKPSPLFPSHRASLISGIKINPWQACQPDRHWCYPCSGTQGPTTHPRLKPEISGKKVSSQHRSSALPAPSICSMHMFELHLPPGREGSVGGHHGPAGDTGPLQSGQYASLQQHGGSPAHGCQVAPMHTLSTTPSIHQVTGNGHCCGIEWGTLLNSWGGRSFQKVLCSAQAMVPEHPDWGGLHHPLWKEGPYLPPSPHHHQM